jgi:Lysine methyltransferase
VCGLLLAKQVPGLNVTLTDLPELQPLLVRNSDRFRNGHDDDDKGLHQYLERGGGGGGGNMMKAVSNSTNPACNSSSSVQVATLDWADASRSMLGQFDVVMGADVVATLYDPCALAETIHRLCRDDETIVYISFKERLSTIHRQFEQHMRNRFSKVQIIDQRENGQPLSRNRNPSVRILIAQQRYGV